MLIFFITTVTSAIFKIVQWHTGTLSVIFSAADVRGSSSMQTQHKANHCIDENVGVCRLVEHQQEFSVAPEQPQHILLCLFLWSAHMLAGKH